MSITILGICLAAVLTAPWTTASAEVILFNSKLIQTALPTPFLPNTEEECDNYKGAADALRKELYEAHEECLKNEDGPSSRELGVTEAEGGTCSRAACQNLHTSRHKVGRDAAQGYTRCLEEVRQRGQVAEGVRTRADSDLEYSLQRLKSASARGARVVVRQVMGEVISQVFGTNSRFVKQGLKVGTTTEFLWERTDAVLQKCYEESTESKRRECNKEVLHTVQTLPSRVPYSVRGDPAVGLIQSAMLDKLNLMLGDVMQQADDLQRDISNIESLPLQRRRQNSVIEND